MNRISARLLLIVLTVLLTTQAWGNANQNAIVDRLNVLETGHNALRGQIVFAPALLQAFYAQQQHQLAWQGTERQLEVVEVLHNSNAHGLIPADYHLAAIETLMATPESERQPAEAADLDLLLTDALVLYGYHLRFGKVNPARLDKNINFQRTFHNNLSPQDIMAEGFSAKSLSDWYAEVYDDGPIYNMIKEALAIYRAIQSDGGWSPIPAGPTLHPGDSGPRVLALKHRLEVTGELAENTSAGDEFDPALEAALTSFQERHQIEADGVAGAQTIEELNVPVSTRIDQMRMTLERIRWLNSQFTGEFIFVNIAGFRAWLVKNGEVTWTQPVMVGKEYRKTPVFSEDLRYIEMNPTWTVPSGILYRDILPKARKDPKYLAEHHMDVLQRNGTRVDPSNVDFNQSPFPYMIRQRPGPDNALGMIKFIFPNQHSVFLHDTPHRELFSHTKRAFSSGCVRVHDPLSLAEVLMNDPQKYSRAGLQSILDTKETQRIYPEDPIRVIIAYVTAWVDLNSGLPRFAPDVYERDAKLLRALDGPVTFELPAEPIAQTHGLTP